MAKDRGAAGHLVKGGIPEPGGSVLGNGEDVPAVRTESPAENVVAMSAQDGQLLARRRVPEARGPVVGRGHHVLAIRAEGCAGHVNAVGLVTLESYELLACGRVPQPREPIVRRAAPLTHAGRDDPLAVRTEPDGGMCYLFPDSRSSALNSSAVFQYACPTAYPT